MDNLQSGDILLFNGKSCVSCLIECFSCSYYSHIGLVLRDPIWLEKGLYVLQSTMINMISDIEQHDVRSGVQINLLSDVLDEANASNTAIYIRHLTITRDSEFQQKLSEIHSKVHAKPYDVNLYDWICAEYNLFHTLPIDISHQEQGTFWCSTLIAYILPTWYTTQ